MITEQDYLFDNTIKINETVYELSEIEAEAHFYRTVSEFDELILEYGAAFVLGKLSNYSQQAIKDAYTS